MKVEVATVAMLAWPQRADLFRNQFLDCRHLDHSPANALARPRGFEIISELNAIPDIAQIQAFSQLLHYAGSCLIGAIGGEGGI